MNIGFTIQVDTLCHRIPNFIEKAAKAGVRRVFIGLENINPDNLIAAKKRQNKITEYREMLQKWREHGAITYAGYIIGFPGDTKESILRDIEIIKRELPLDILEFFFLTPLPGSEDHKVLWQKGAWMDPDLNKYDLNHRVSHHSKMSDAEWEESLRGRLGGVLHARARADDPAPHRGEPARPAEDDVDDAAVVQADDRSFEHVHPLEGGALRMKHRRDRRYGVPLESASSFTRATCRDRRQRPRATGRSIAKTRRSMKGPERARPADLHRSRHRSARAGRIRNSRPLSRDRAAARRRWPASAATTRFASAWPPVPEVENESPRRSRWADPLLFLPLRYLFCRRRI